MMQTNKNDDDHEEYSEVNQDTDEQYNIQTTNKKPNSSKMTAMATPVKKNALAQKNKATIKRIEQIN